MIFKNLLKDKRGVFGLTAVQAFFAIILSLALLAFIIVIIMGLLTQTTIVPQIYAGTVTNDSTVTVVNETGANLSVYTTAGVACTLIQCVNSTDGVLVPSANYTLSSGCNVKYSGSAAAVRFNNTIWKCSYSYTRDAVHKGNLNSIMVNTSQGVTSFFGAINPVYAILAVLVIILVLVVLVRVVQQPGQRTSPQL